MNNGWIIDVLEDLRSFAENNGLMKLERELLQVAMVASKEIGAAGAVPHGDEILCRQEPRLLHNLLE